MLTTTASVAPQPLAHNVIGEGLHWLHTVTQPDTAIINPRLAAIIVNRHILRFVPIAWGGSAAVIVEVADVHWGVCGGPLNPLPLDTIANTARLIRACGDTISDIRCATAPLTATLQIQQPPRPTLRAAAQRYLRGCPVHHSRRCDLPPRRGGYDCPWYSDAQRAVTWPFTGYTPTLRPAQHAALSPAGHKDLR
jgi:hypothetical protein